MVALGWLVLQNSTVGRPRNPVYNSLKNDQSEYGGTRLSLKQALTVDNAPCTNTYSHPSRWVMFN